MKFNWRRTTIAYIVMLIVSIAVFTFFLPSASEQPVEISQTQLVELSQQHQIEKISIDGDQINITTNEAIPRELFTYKESLTSIYDIPGFDPTGIEISPVGNTGIDWGAVFINFIPILIIGGIIIFLFSQARGANSQAMQFGRSRAKMFNVDKPTNTFSDVAGVDEAKQEVEEVVEFLKSREKFQALGARIPKGVLLIGYPGTGKTLLARAIAGEAGVPFFSISGSEFVEMFVGVGASRVRDLFKQAKLNAPCIIFIDEIDAVGRQRGAGLGGSHDEREQTLNQILVEMDGFESNTTIIVIAATNRPDVLDPALLRPGRFDRRVVLDMPDLNGRHQILQIHAKGKPLADNVNLETLAKQTIGFSGADLSNLMNEGAILAARASKKVIEMSDLEESIDRVIAGPERKNRKVNQHEKEITAYHEAGHALVARMLPSADPVHKITIVARGMAGGYTKQLPSEDRYIATRSQFAAKIAIFMGGRLAEEIVFDEMSTGASQDFKEATNLAKKMVTSYGMSEKLGPRTFGSKEEMVFLGKEIHEQRDYGEKTADLIDQEVEALIQAGYQLAKTILTDNRDRLRYIAERLVAVETLEGEELEKLFTEPVPPPAEKDTSAVASVEKPEKVAEPAKTKAKARAKNRPADPDPGTAAAPAPAT
ncbi:MAG: ATP-dependent zinc metalloprotease FtsH [Dehalogenimonas sp.]|jgi:cell division protease FtsH|uniref:ATP-dependent zinc metalloprotease FtsH n=1 Tax=Candidatus Dehalogenimonas loeffleri TaxID=3127115 RepID=A0ABZ2J490_9CHLR|nr:ATP-dependent zinc metalloprotease FtsH [Dehalogenimonas sp.]